MRNTADVVGGKPTAVCYQSILVVSAVNPFVAFYDMHGERCYSFILSLMTDVKYETWKIEIGAFFLRDILFICVHLASQCIKACTILICKNIARVKQCYQTKAKKPYLPCHPVLGFLILCVHLQWHKFLCLLLKNLYVVFVLSISCNPGVRNRRTE
jgi:hypothetical protein